MNVAVIGASNKPNRYSYKALKLLQEKGHQVFGVHKRITEIEGSQVFKEVKDLPDDIDTLTMYVSADVSMSMKDQMINKKPKRVIFNPGAENQDLARSLKENNIEVREACTIVLLKTNQF